MEEINENIVIENRKKSNLWLWIILGIIALTAGLFFLQSWNDDRYQQLKGQYELLEDKYSQQKSVVAEIESTRLKQKDSLILVINEREKENEILEQENISLQDKIEIIESEVISVPNDIPGLVNYFNTRYSTRENAVVEDKVGLGQNSAYKASYELEEKDNLTEIVVLKDKQIENKDSQIFLLNEDKQNLNTLFTSAEEEILQRKELQSIAEGNIQNLEKQVKNLTRNKTVNKILIPLVAVISGFVGYQIAK